VKRAFEAAGVEFIEENGGDIGVRLRNDGSEINKVIVPVIFGPRIVSGYVGFRVHVVRRGDTLSAIAKDNYGDARRYNDIVRANPLIVSDPDRIFPGQQLKIPIGAQ
jgi:nucleoid-associated protein YgaU